MAEGEIVYDTMVSKGSAWTFLNAFASAQFGLVGCFGVRVEGYLEANFPIQHELQLSLFFLVCS